jgi:hypothetical protein
MNKFSTVNYKADGSFMLFEGIYYENQKKGINREPVSKRETGRIVSEIGIKKVSSVISELTKEFNGKKR